MKGVADRWSRSQLARNSKDMAPIAPDNGSISLTPSDGGDFPELPARALSPPPLLGPFESPADSDSFPGYGGRALGGPAPKRKDGEPDDPTPKLPRTDSQKAQDAADEGSLARLQLPSLAPAGAAVVTGRGPQQAFLLPMACCPPYETLVLIGALRDP